MRSAYHSHIHIDDRTLFSSVGVFQKQVKREEEVREGVRGTNRARLAETSRHRKQDATTETHLEVFTHSFCDRTEPNTREVIDREASVLRIVHREDLCEVLGESGIIESLRELLEPNLLGHFLQKDLDENTTTRSRVIFVHLHD